MSAYEPSDFRVTGQARPIFSQLSRGEQRGIMHAIVLDQKSKTQILGTLESLKDAPARIVAGALNEAAHALRSKVVEALALKTILPEHVIDAYVTVAKEATHKRDKAVVKIDNKPLPLTDYGAYESDEGVYARTLPNGVERLYDRGFLSTMPDGSYGAYERDIGAGRLPISEITGPSIPSLAQQTPGALERLERTARIELAKALANAVVKYDAFDQSDKLYSELAYLFGTD